MVLNLGRQRAPEATLRSSRAGKTMTARCSNSLVDDLLQFRQTIRPVFEWRRPKKVEKYKETEHRTEIVIQIPTSALPFIVPFLAANMTRLSLSSLFFVIQFTAIVHAVEVITNSGDLYIVNKVLGPDGFERDTIIPGATADSASMPGPLIRGNKGDRFSINVIDALHDSTMNQTTSIHWHGIFQEHTNWADGTDFVTQCPIAPNNSFLYDFTIPDQAGTFWYHSHESVQYCDGLRGPLVVYDPQDPLAYLYDVDDETTIITISDWYHLTGLEVLAFQIATQTGALSNATLINGLGRNPQNSTAPLAVINVEQGKRYRFRLISMACDPSYQFSIDGHNLTVIEADGISTEPVTVNSITIYAAQRYSFVLNATQPVNNYWVRALPNPQIANAPAGPFTNGINSAILRYQGAAAEEPTTSQAPQSVNLTESLLHPLQNPGAPGQPFHGGADMVINFTLGFDNQTAQFLVNNTPFVAPTVPVLLQILSGTQNAQDLLPAGSVYSLPKNKTIEINFSNGNAVGGPHPFHLHGHAFDVVKSFDSDTFNFVNPVRRDTTPVANGSLTTIRFTTDNPGPWFLHCHVDFHLASGLAVVMAEDLPDIQAANPVPADWDKLCPEDNALTPSQL